MRGVGGGRARVVVVVVAVVAVVAVLVVVVEVVVGSWLGGGDVSTPVICAKLPQRGPRGCGCGRIGWWGMASEEEVSQEL